VSEKEHTAFLNLWLEHLFFCGPSLAPTKNYLPLAYELAKDHTIGLGKLFLGEIYRYLHLMSLNLLSQRKLRTGGPWWFIQLWAHLYFQDFIPNFPSLANNSFPDQSGRQIRCTSFGQALYSLPGGKLNPSDASRWFRIFYKGLDNPIFLPYAEYEIFESPATFRLADFTDDIDTRRLYSIMIRPCLLPVGMSTSNRIIKSGYEFYQPVVAARQFGLGQMPPHFLLHHLTSNRVDLPDAVTTQRCYSLFSDLFIPIPIDLAFISSAIDFEGWWMMWKTHVFRKALGPMLQRIHAEYGIPEGEVLLSTYHFSLLWQNHLNYSGSSALVIAVQPILTQRTSKGTIHWSVGSSPDTTMVQQDRSRFTSREGEFTITVQLINFLIYRNTNTIITSFFFNLR
jgi:hypothetical protein